MISVGEISGFHRGVAEVFALRECCVVCFTVSTLKMMSIGRPETSVSNYQNTPPKIPEERRPNSCLFWEPHETHK